MAKRFYTITPVTGVHIGTGEELSPLDYKIASKIENVDFKKQVYLKFSSDRILQRLYAEKKPKAVSDFESASVKGNMKELFKFFQDNCIYAKDTDYPCDITKSFLKKYMENLEKDPHRNAAKVLQMYHAEGMPNPVIPGSSVKGSVRTALLNRYLENLFKNEKQKYQKMLDDFEREKKIHNNKFVKFEEGMQKKLLDYKDAKYDPLRAVLFSDCSFKAFDTQLVGGLDNVFSKQNEVLEPISVQIQAEVLKGELLGGKAESELCITINDKLQKTPFPTTKPEERPKSIKKITFEDIQKSCNDLYWKEFQNEYDAFYKNISDGSEKIITELKGRLEAAVKSEKQFIIRVGRWSQVEFVTFEDNFREPKTRVIKGKKLSYGKTRTLFDYDGKYAPMGWCILTVKG